MRGHAPGEPGGFGGALQAALFARRVLLVSGELDEGRAGDLAAALMTLDATGDARVELRLSAATGGVEAALLLADVIATLGVPVHTVALGILSGGPVAVLAAGERRTCARHARLVLCEPDAGLAGRASDLERALVAGVARREQFHELLAARTKRPRAVIAEEWSRGAALSDADAVSLGYVDRVERD